MAESAHPTGPAEIYPGPLDTGVTAALTVLLMHFLATASGNIRRTDGGWPWLDAYRIGHPSGWSGWLIYFGYGLVVALALGVMVAGGHWAAWRSTRHRRARQLLGWWFMLVAAAVGFLAPLCLHRFPRVPDRPHSALQRTRPAAAVSVLPSVVSADRSAELRC